MASIQRIGFTRDQNDLSKIFKALGHPARINIIHLLLEKEHVCCKDLALEMGFSAPTVTHHLKILAESGLIGYEKISNLSYHVVNPILIDKAKEALGVVSNKAESQDTDYRNVVFCQQPLPDSF